MLSQDTNPVGSPHPAFATPSLKPYYISFLVVGAPLTCSEFPAGVAFRKQNSMAWHGFIIIGYSKIIATTGKEAEMQKEMISIK